MDKTGLVELTNRIYGIISGAETLYTDIENWLMDGDESYIKNSDPIELAKEFNTYRKHARDSSHPKNENYIVIVDGARTDNDKELYLADTMWRKHLSHYALVAIMPGDGKVTVKIISKPKEVLGLADNTVMVGQWGSEWGANYFQFTAADAKRHLPK
jgi:hypothetical protein